MVTIIDFSTNENAEGDSFVSLHLQGDITMIQSKTSGRFYATSKTARMACTFDEATAKMMVGKQIPGSIQKVSCEPYDYVIPDSNGDVVTLEYTYQYVPDAQPVQKDELKANLEEFSTNGKHEVVEN